MTRLYIAVFILLSAGLFAQEKTPLKLPSIPDKEDELILNFNLDNWTNLPASVESKMIRSRGFSFLIMTDQMNRKGNIGFGAGLGFMSQNVHTNSYIIDTGSATILSPIPDSIDYDLNKLSSNFITGALEFRLRSNENKKGERFKLSVGFLAGYLVQSHDKYEDNDGKFKTYHIAHLEKFQYGIEGRLGYNNVALYGYYSLVTVFKKNQGPEMNPVSFGISVTI